MTYAGVQTDFWEIQCKRRYYVVIIRTLYQIQIFPYYSTNNVSFDFPSIVTKLFTLNCTRNHFNSKYFVAADYVVPRCSIVLPVFLKRTNYFSVLVPLGDISFPFTLFKHDLVNKTFHSTNLFVNTVKRVFGSKSNRTNDHERSRKCKRTVIKRKLRKFLTTYRKKMMPILPSKNVLDFTYWSPRYKALLFCLSFEWSSTQGRQP